MCLPLKKKRIKGICEVLYCRHKVPGNTKKCGGCRRKEGRMKDPVRYAWQTAKDNARRRRKEWTITLSQFRVFCKKNQYIRGKGIYRDSYHLDRIREEEGYHIWNIQVLKNYKNVKKFLNYHWHEPTREMIASLTIVKR